MSMVTIQNQSLIRIADSLEELVKMQKVSNDLENRVETLEKMIEKVPEFYDYWKGLNCCGYQD